MSTPLSEASHELQEEEDDLAVEEMQPFGNVSTTAAAGVLERNITRSECDDKTSINCSDGVTTPTPLPTDEEIRAGVPVVEPAPGGSSSPPYSRFTHRQKIGITLSVSFLAIISPLSGQIYLPALNELATDLHVSVSQINLTITAFMVRFLSPQLF